ncbi:MAG: phospholipase/carboxylesterase [Alphaproteobacteria bacterium]|nr:phospholipase/carboxylesterase [Alphaproteobacteria bacterium]
MTTSQPDLEFTHRFIPATDKARPPLLLLHGTGGDENDLLPLGARLSPGAALLSPRGKVLENGMPRFFRRLAEGVFDIDDLKARTVELADFIAKAREAYGLEKPIAVGFSNGANIAASLLLTRPDVLAAAVLMRAMTPFEPQIPPDLAGMPVLMLSGASDPIVPPENRDHLAALLKTAGASVTHEVVPAGHGLSPEDLTAASRWFAARR